MNDDNVIHETIAQIYDAAISPSTWQEVIQSIVRLTGSMSGALVAGNQGNESEGIYAAHEIDPD